MKKRAVNWWSFTSTMRLCFRAPFLWNTGTLGGGDRGEGRGEEPPATPTPATVEEGEEVEEVELAEDGEEARVSGESDGEGETGVDMLP